MDLKALLGTTIAENYELLSIAGAGGMGTVFKAKQHGLERIVAVKVLDPQQVVSEESLLRFEREAKSISLLSHIHIASFFAYGILENALPYIVMEWLEGTSLSAFIQDDSNKRGVSPDRALKIAIQIADGLYAAHQQGIVHRDMKPANVILLSDPEPDFVKVVDFGLARIDESLVDSSGQRLTRTGELLGTPQYLSPEQCQGGKADARSDIYSLGCIVYEMVCSQPPIQADNAIAMIHKHVNEQVVPPSKRSTQILPEGLEFVLMKCLKKEPSERYQSMLELSSDLRSVADKKGASIAASLGPSAQVRSKKKTLLLLSLSISVIVTLAFAFYFFSSASLTYRAKLSLSSDKSTDNIIKWQHTVEQLVRDGKKDDSYILQDEIHRSLGLNKMPPQKAMEACLALAKQFLKNGDNHSASHFALLTVKYANLAAKEGAELEALAIPADDAVKIIKDSKYLLRHDELNSVVAIVMKVTSILEKMEKKSSFEFLVKEYSRVRTNLLSDNLLTFRRATDCVLARQGRIQDLDKHLSDSLLNFSFRAEGHNYELPSHLANLAKILSYDKYDLAKEECKKLLLMAEERLADCTIPRNNSYYATVDEISEVAYSLKDYPMSIKYAYLAVDRPFTKTDGLAASYIHLLRALRADRKTKEAESVSQKLELYLNKFADDQEKFEYVASRADYYFAEKRYKDALEILEAELLVQRKNPKETGRIKYLLHSLRRVYLNLKMSKELISCLKELLSLSQGPVHASERFELQTELVSSPLSLGEPADAEQIKKWIALVKSDPDQTLESLWSPLTLILNRLNKVKTDPALYDALIELMKAEYILQLENSSTKSEIFYQGLRYLLRKGRTEASFELFKKTLRKLQDLRRFDIASNYSAVLMDEARKQGNYSSEEKLLKESIEIVGEPNSDNWILCRLLACHLNTALQSQSKYEESIEHLRNLVKRENQFTKSPQDLFEIRAAIIYGHYRLGRLKACSEAACDLLRLEKVDRGWELPRLWYLYSVLLVEFKAKNEPEGYNAIRELVRQGFLQSLTEKDRNIQVLSDVLSLLKKINEDSLVQELLNAASKDLTKDEFQKLKSQKLKS